MGRLLRAEPGATIPVPDVVGDVLGEATPGVVEFTVRGRPYRLDALEAMPGHLWLIFRDATSGHETYGGGRFLVSGAVEPGPTRGWLAVPSQEVEDDLCRVLYVISRAFGEQLRPRHR